jgi:hypothetical protein
MATSRAVSIATAAPFGYTHTPAPDLANERILG